MAKTDDSESSNRKRAASFRELRELLAQHRRETITMALIPQGPPVDHHEPDDE